MILANALVLALQTYPGLERRHGDTRDLLNDIFLAFFGVGPAPVAERIQHLRAALQELELELGADDRTPRDRSRGERASTSRSGEG